VTLVLGIDPGSRRCGYGVVRSEGPRLSYVAAGVIDVGTKRPLAARLVEIGEELSEVCNEVQAQRQPGEPVAAGIESGYVDGHGATALVLGAARGVALYVVASAFGCEVRQYEPSTVKKAATGSGKADKAQVARMVALRLRMKREPTSDAADAIAIAITRAQDAREDVR